MLQVPIVSNSTTIFPHYEGQTAYVRGTTNIFIAFSQAEEKEKYRIKVEGMFEQLLQRISLMDKIAEQ